MCFGGLQLYGDARVCGDSVEDEGGVSADINKSLDWYIVLVHGILGGVHTDAMSCFLLVRLGKDFSNSFGDVYVEIECLVCSAYLCWHVCCTGLEVQVFLSFSPWVGACQLGVASSVGDAGLSQRLGHGWDGECAIGADCILV